MDPRKWLSESQAAQHETRALQEAEAKARVCAGTHKDCDKKSPSFFAWSIDATTAAAAAGSYAEVNVEGGAINANEDEASVATGLDSRADGWVRTGNGWKSADGIFYSDDDLVADVLTKVAAEVEDAVAATTAADADEAEEDGGTDNSADCDEYCTEAEDQFRWAIPQPAVKRRTSTATGSSPDHHGPLENMLPTADAWMSEYDSQSAVLAAAITAWSGATAGMHSGQGGKGANPLCFSWSRSKKDNSTSAPAPAVTVVPPFDIGVPNPGKNWASEYDSKFVTDEQRQATATATDAPAAAASPSAGTANPPYDIGVPNPGKNWASEYDSNFQGQTEEEAVGAAASVPAARGPWQSEYDASFVVPAAAADAAASADVPRPAADSIVFGPAKALSFKASAASGSESTAAFKWPAASAKTKRAKMTNHVVITPIPEKDQTAARPVLSLAQQERADAYFTTEMQSKFNALAVASEAGAGPATAASTRCNASNFSSPRLLDHVVVEVNAQARAAAEAEDEEDSDYDPEEDEAESGDSDEEDEDEGEDAFAEAAEAGTRLQDSASLQAAADSVAAAASEWMQANGFELDSLAGTSVTGPPLLVRGKRILRMGASSPGQGSPAPAPRTRNKAHLKGRAALLDRQQKASRVAALQNIHNSRNAKKPSPVLRNRRYPGTSDAQNLRWRSEAGSAYQWRKQPLQL